jgi:hypothetical protein
MISQPFRYGLTAAIGIFLLINCRTAGAIAPTLIANCQEIDKPGFYEIESTIVTSVVGPCIDITAAGVTLSLQAGLTGDGAHGTGIRIEHGATGTVIQGWGPAVSSFAVGVEDDQGGSVIGGFPVTKNAATGLLLVHADNDVCMDISANNNGHDGIHITQTSGARIDASSANFNGTYGVWIDGSTGSLIDSIQASGNGTTNVEISRLGGTASTGNILYHINANGAPNGIVIEKKNSANRVTRSGPLKGTPATIEDGLDHNAKCGTNRWFNNSFVTRKPACVH